MINELQNNASKIGYFCHYPDPQHPTEKFRMDIFISSTPTKRYFDVHNAHFSVESIDNGLTSIVVSHPWPYQKSFHICPGVVILEDQKGDREEVFTFGGHLEIKQHDNQTECNLTSTAPILEISDTTPLHQFLIEEIEIILAEQRAKYTNVNAYETQLCKVDPFKLYLACINAITKKLESFEHKDRSYQHLLIELHTQKHRLAAAGLAKGPRVTVNSLFKRN